jgi:hypothetical protein
MRRRQFLALLGSMAIAFPADVVAQKPDRARRIGVLIPATASSALGLRRAKIFTQALQDLGWTDGQNTRIDYRWPGGDIEQIHSEQQSIERKNWGRQHLPRTIKTVISPNDSQTSCSDFLDCW